jgi:hypothetical protein
MSVQNLGPLICASAHQATHTQITPPMTVQIPMPALAYTQLCMVGSWWGSCEVVEAEDATPILERGA